MLNTIIVACMLAGATPNQTIQQPKDTTTVVIRVPKIKKPTWGPGTK